MTRSGDERSPVARRLRRALGAALRAPEYALEHFVRPRRLAARVEHVAGPTQVEYGADEVVAICVVRNGELHVRSFIEHHLGLGVRHLVLLDNGSTDRTVSIAREYARVTVLRTACPYRRYENVMKRYLARRFSAGRWNLCVDIDERFDYPFSDRVPLGAFLRYLNGHGFTAVVAQMLDRFPDARLVELGGASPDAIEVRHAFYDLSAIEKTAYPYGTLPDPGVRMHWGGIRQALFGTRNGLTKAALVRVDAGVRLFVHWHHVEPARIADVTAVLHHYPFGGDFVARVADAVTHRRYGRSAGHEYRRYLAGVAGALDQPLRGPGARRFTGLEPLLDEGFLVASAAYRRWAAEHARGSAP